MGKIIDLTGQKFEKLTVIKKVENYVSPKGQTQSQWLCQCECYGEDSLKIISSSNLKRGKVKSCGCLPKPIKDLIGQRFGRLVVIERVGKGKRGDSIWLCECDCGNKNKAYVQFLDGTCIRGNDAITIQNILKRNSQNYQDMNREYQDRLNFLNNNVKFYKEEWNL